MTKASINSFRKIAQYLLFGGFILGIMASVLRLILGFIGVSSIPAIMNTAPDVAQNSSGFMASAAPFVFAVSPYLLAVGAISAFLYIYFFRDTESRNVFIGWGILMTLHLAASRFFSWL